MNKLCIFDKQKACNECGHCYVCDLNSNKKCNNCGKCLEIEGYDMKAINIEDIIEKDEDFLDFEHLNDLHNNANMLLNEDEEIWDYIDDIKELKDLIENDNEQNIHEEFPGLFIYKGLESRVEDAE